jgi:hypothetical protein
MFGWCKKQQLVERLRAIRAMCFGASRGKKTATLHGAQGAADSIGHDGHLDRFKPSWDDAAGRFSLDVQIGAPLKWMCQQASFASVFSGSNDRNGATANVEIIADHLARVASIGKVSLVSVIGGAFLLDLVQRVGFSRVLLFDQNVAEFAKISALLNLMAQDPNGDPVEGVERMILARPDALLPRLPLSEVSYSLAPDSDWEFEGGEEDAFPLLLRKRNYPHYAWNAGPEERALTLARLKTALCRNVFLELPSIDAAGHLVVVFCSNADEAVLPDAFVRSKFVNAAGVIILRSLIGDNRGALDPHPYWEVVARSTLEGKSHQLWAPEDAALVGGPLDRTTNTSSVLGRPFPAVEPQTLLCHILMGKCRGSRSERAAAVGRSLQSLPTSVRRVVVAEHHPDRESEARDRKAFDSMERLLAFYSENLRGFWHADTLCAPGGGDPRRNVFLVFARN